VIVFIMWMPSKQSVTVTVVHSCMEKQDFVHVLCVYVWLCTPWWDSRQQGTESPAENRTWPVIFSVSINLSLPLSIFLLYASVNSSKGREIAGPSTHILASHDASIQQTHNSRKPNFS